MIQLVPSDDEANIKLNEARVPHGSPRQVSLGNTIKPEDQIMMGNHEGHGGHRAGFYRRVDFSSRAGDPHPHRNILGAANNFQDEEPGDSQGDGQSDVGENSRDEGDHGHYRVQDRYLNVEQHNHVDQHDHDHEEDNVREQFEGKHVVYIFRNL